MAVLLTGAGSLFVRLGHEQAEILNINKLRNSAIAGIDYSVTVDSRFSTILTDYANGTARRDLVDQANLQLDSWKSAQSAILSYFRTLMTNTVVEMVNDDTKLTAKAIKPAMTELIRQMVVTSDTVNASAPAVGSQTAQGSPVGTPIIVVSVKNGNGKLLEYVFAETMKFAVTGDSQGTATARREPFFVTGPAAVGDSLSHLWPAGSGGAGQVNASDGSANNSNGNKLQNSDFETFTNANQPDNWDRVVGVIGTNILDGNGNGYTGSKSVAFVSGGGGVLAAIKQQFNVTPATTADGGGTSAKLSPETPYAFSCWIKGDSAIVAGVLKISLVDGSDTVINDSAGTANTITVTVGGVISTSWVNVSGVFRLPADLPDEVNLKIYLTTALTSGRTLYIDRACLNQMTQFYTGGPFFSIFSGATDVLINDTWTLDITNTWGKIQQMAERVFGMRAMGLQLPSDSVGGETILDSLIV